MVSAHSTARASSPSGRKWTEDEHARYLEALALYPTGSWKQRAEYVGTRSARQVMTHAQKLALKAERHARGLRKAGRPRTRGRANAGHRDSVAGDLSIVAWSETADDALEALLETLRDDADTRAPPSPLSPSTGAATFTFPFVGNDASWVVPDDDWLLELQAVV